MADFFDEGVMEPVEVRECSIDYQLDRWRRQ